MTVRRAVKSARRAARKKAGARRRQSLIAGKAAGLRLAAALRAGGHARNDVRNTITD